MPSKAPLTHASNTIKVLVTRPEHQAQALTEQLTAIGAQAISLPVIRIVAHKLTPDMEKLLKNIKQVDYIIFISPNAVTYGLSALFTNNPLLKNQCSKNQYPRNPCLKKLKLVTIGQSSAKKIEQILGYSPDISPKEQYNTEALLALNELQSQQINAKNILIFRGVGGRELLATSLQERGARVNYIELYQRLITHYSNTYLTDMWSMDNKPDIITLTSNEGLNNLVTLIKNIDDNIDDNSALDLLWQTPLIVITETMRQNALALGFKQSIMIADKASDHALVASVLKWAKINQDRS